MCGQRKVQGEVGMIFARLIVQREDSYESRPFLFCSKCKAYLVGSEFRFCPWCGHKLKPASKVQLIETNGNEVTEHFRDQIDFVRERVKWNE